MKLYNYDPVTFCYLSVEDACVDPVESAKTGKVVYFISENSTTVAPPTADENEVAQYNTVTKKWSLIADYRGKTLYKKSNGTLQVIMDTLGEFSVDYTLEPYPGIHSSEYKWSDLESKWVHNDNYEESQATSYRNSILLASDAKVLRYNSEKVLVAAGVLTATTNTEAQMLQWEIYRQQLREWMDNWSSNKPFPVAPDMP